jgi:hypothetical protein
MHTDRTHLFCEAAGLGAGFIQGLAQGGGFSGRGYVALAGSVHASLQFEFLTVNVQWTRH